MGKKKKLTPAQKCKAIDREAKNLGLTVYHSIEPAEYFQFGTAKTLDVVTTDLSYEEACLWLEGVEYGQGCIL